MRDSVYPEDLAPALEKLVVGHRIVAAKDDTLTLDNGVTITIDGSSDCCAWGDASLGPLVNSESVITSVTYTEDDRDEKAQVFLLTNAGPALVINQEWDASNGYYFYGLYLTVTGVEQ